MAFAALLAEIGVAHGLIGPREVPRLWDRHLLPGAVPAVLIPRGAGVCDVGSGAGLPGVLLALARPDLMVTLLEPMERRCRFLRQAVSVARLEGQVSVRHGRAEDLASAAGTFDTVVARAVARLPRLLEILLPLARPGGQVLAVKGAGVQTEIDEASTLLSGQHIASWDIVELPVPAAPVEEDPVRIVRIVLADSVATSTDRPRRGMSPRSRRGREAGQR